MSLILPRKILGCSPQPGVQSRAVMSQGLPWAWEVQHSYTETVGGTNRSHTPGWGRTKSRPATQTLWEQAGWCLWEQRKQGSVLPHALPGSSVPSADQAVQPQLRDKEEGE